MIGYLLTFLAGALVLFAALVYINVKTEQVGVVRSMKQLALGEGYEIRLKIPTKYGKIKADKVADFLVSQCELYFDIFERKEKKKRVLDGHGPGGHRVEIPRKSFVDRDYPDTKDQILDRLGVLHNWRLDDADEVAKKDAGVQIDVLTKQLDKILEAEKKRDKDK